MTELRQRMLDAMVQRGFAARTQETYVRAIRRMAKHYRRDPALYTVQEVQAYLLHMVKQQKLSYSSMNQAACAAQFLFQTVLGHTREQFHIPFAKVPIKQPELLARLEIARLFACCAHPAYRMALQTMYATGLRVSEVSSLRCCDIDSAADRMCVRVNAGKGGADRYSVLSPTLLQGVAFTARANGKAGKRLVRLEGTEFVRRFMLHILPTGLKRIRHYGGVGQRLQGQEAGAGARGFEHARAKRPSLGVRHGFPAPRLAHRGHAVSALQSWNAAHSRGAGRAGSPCCATGRHVNGFVQGAAVKVRAKFAKRVRRRTLARRDAARAPPSSVVRFECKAPPRRSSASAARDAFVRLMPATVAAKALARP